MPKDAANRRQRWLILACILCALLPLIVCVMLGIWRGIDNAQAENDRRAKQILETTGRILDHAEQRLRDLRWSAAQACDEDVIEAMVYGVYNSIYIREMGVFDSDFGLMCTNFGRLYVKIYQDIKHRLPRSGLFYNVVKTVVMKERSVIVNLRFEHGAGINALIDPAVFAALIDTANARTSRSLVLRFKSGDTIYDVHNDQVSNARFGIVSQLALDRRPLSIRIEGSDEEVWTAIRQTLPAFLVAGFGLMLVAAWCLRLVWNRLHAPEEALRQALLRREFVAHFQPIINIETGLCDGTEALMRWQHPDAGLIPPDSFIPIAERCGLIKPMTALLIERVCSQLGPMLRNRNLYVAVNLSRSHLEDLDIVRDLLTSCTRFDVPPATFVFEITERGLPDSIAQARVCIEALKALGCRIAIDDFGTGHNGLSVLEKLSADILKIDRSFVEPIGEGTAKAAVIDSIIDLAARLGLTVVAEGVETAVQLEYLRARQVGYAQGFHFAQAMESADLVLFLERTMPWRQSRP